MTWLSSSQLLLTDELPAFPRLRAVVADRACRGLDRLAAKRRLALDINASPPGVSRFAPLRQLVKVEHAFAQLGHWRRISRCHERTEASACAWVGWPPWGISSPASASSPPDRSNPMS